MTGRICYSSDLPGRRVRLQREQIRGLSLLRADIPLRPGLSEAARHRRIVSAARLLSRHGAGRVLLPPDCPVEAVPARYRPGRVETGAFLKVLSPALVLALMRRWGLQPEQVTVKLFGSGADRLMRQAAVEMSRHVRRLVLCAGPEGRELARLLSREYGLPQLEERAGADIAVCFSGQAQGAFQSTLHLSGDEILPDGLSILPPEDLAGAGGEPVGLCALLWGSGRLKMEEMTILP